MWHSRGMPSYWARVAILWTVVNKLTKGIKNYIPRDHRLVLTLLQADNVSAQDNMKKKNEMLTSALVSPFSVGASGRSSNSSIDNKVMNGLTFDNLMEWLRPPPRLDFGGWCSSGLGGLQLASTNGGTNFYWAIRSLARHTDWQKRMVKEWLKWVIERVNGRANGWWCDPVNSLFMFSSNKHTHLKCTSPPCFLLFGVSPTLWPREVVTKTNAGKEISWDIFWHWGSYVQRTSLWLLLRCCCWSELRWTMVAVCAISKMSNLNKVRQWTRLVISQPIRAGSLFDLKISNKVRSPPSPHFSGSTICECWVCPGTRYWLPVLRCHKCYWSSSPIVSHDPSF